MNAFENILLHNAAEFLSILCVAGIGSAFYRLPRAARPDILIAFILFISGTLLREVVVHFYGVIAWPASAIYFSGLARLVQIVGAILFIRAAIKDQCDEWGWMWVAGVAAFIVLVV